MTFEDMFKSAQLLGYTPEQMKHNCREQLFQNISVPSWRKAVPRCLKMLKWLDRKCSPSN